MNNKLDKPRISRSTVVCTFCRKRKIKCDRKRPCSSCIKLHNPFCQYNDETPKNFNALELIKKLSSKVDVLDKVLNSSNVFETKINSDGVKQSNLFPKDDNLDLVWNYDTNVNVGVKTGNNGNNKTVVNEIIATDNMVGDHRKYGYDNNKITQTEGTSKCNDRANDFNNTFNSSQLPFVDDDPIFRKQYGSFDESIFDTFQFESLGSLHNNIREPETIYDNFDNFQFDVDVNGNPVIYEPPQFPNSLMTESNKSPDMEQQRVQEREEQRPQVDKDQQERSEREDHYKPEDDMEISFFDLYNPIDSNKNFYGPFSWFAIYNSDLELHHIWSKLENFDEFRVIYDNPLCKEVKLNINIFQNWTSENVKNYEKLVNDIEKSLPKRSVVLELLNIFFNKIIVFFTVVDENTFRNELNKIIINDSGNDSGDKNIKFQINKLEELYTIGLLCLIIKSTYLSEYNHFKDHIIGENLIDHVISIVNSFDLLKNNDLEFFQLLLFLRCYQALAPEYGEAIDSNTSNVFGTILTQKAYNLKLNKDPSTFIKGKDGKLNNLRRKLWIFCLLYDTLPILASGNPPNMTKFDNYSTKLPYINNINQNTNNIDIEKICALVSNNAKNFKKFKNTSLAFGQSTFQINKLRIDIERHFDSIVEKNIANKLLLNNNNQLSKYFFKTFKLKFFFQQSAFLINGYYYIFQSYLRSNKLGQSLEILRSLFKFVYQQVFPILTEISINSYDTSPYKSENSVNKFILGQAAQSLINKIIIINIVMLTKVDGELFELISKCCDIYLDWLKRISTTYYYSWRMLKIHKSFMAYIIANRSNCVKIVPLFSNDPIILNVIKDALHDLDAKSFMSNVGDKNDDTIWLQILALKKVTNKTS